MKLVLSGPALVNSTLSTPDGRPVFRTIDHTSKGGFGRRRLTAQKYAPATDEWVTYASAEFREFHDDVLVVGGYEGKAKDYFRKESKGRGFWGRNRVFTAPDGREYRWKLTTPCELYTADAAAAPVTQFEKARGGLFRDKAPAALEILPPGEQVADVVVFTFAYMECVRSLNQGTPKAGVDTANAGIGAVTAWTG